MLSTSRWLRHLKPKNAFIAALICYAMIVQGFAAHVVGPDTTQKVLHELCLSGSGSGENETPPTHPAPDHSHSAPCCLIFGSGDLPRIRALISAHIFQISPALYPTQEFVNLIHKRIVFAQSLPRAPPLNG